jgi:hypothetical protein
MPQIMALRTEVIAAFPCAPSPIFEQCGLFRSCILSNNLYNKQSRRPNETPLSATDLHLS